VTRASDSAGTIDARQAIETDVLIVGAGPVGLSLAIELGHRGVRCLVVEQNERVGYQPRAKTLHVRSMEHFRRWGMAENIRRADPLPGYPTNIVFATRLTGYPLARFENAFNAGRARNDLYSESAQWIPQYATEAVLRDFALDLPAVDLRFNCRLETATQTSDGIDAEVADAKTGARQAVRAKYLVGADGARSKVRELLGIRMLGQHAYVKNVMAIVRAPGLAQMHDQGPAVQYWLVNPEVPAVMGVMDRDDMWFFGVVVPDGKPSPSADELVRLMHKAVGREFAAEIVGIDNWLAHRLMATRYGDGRMWLTGDACHLHPPMGGYGMNMGIADAVDLGWKLAAVIQGWGGAALLDSYERERRPVHERVINEAVENYAVLADHLVQDGVEKPGAEGDAARQLVGERILASKVREFRTLGVILGYCYRDSPVIVPDGSAAPAEQVGVYEPSAHPGCVAPHLWCADGSSLYDHFGPGFTLLATDSSGERETEPLIEAARRRGVPLALLAPREAGLADLYQARFALVRPDQHVAWRGDALPDDLAGLLDAVCGRTPARKTKAALAAHMTH
jgi:2-polyprenyl-6-methoxyphenol hydroxylase-like FAD-dependent oxidoreductase